MLGPRRNLGVRTSDGPELTQKLEKPRAVWVMVPAACYPLYPTLRGTLPEAGRLYDFTAYCFRREPSEDPTRMQAFQVRENVRLGSPDQVRTWREGWTRRGLGFLEGLPQLGGQEYIGQLVHAAINLPAKQLVPLERRIVIA